MVDRKLLINDEKVPSLKQESSSQCMRDEKVEILNSY